MINEYRKLHLVVLDADQHKRTCGYWYLVRESSLAHTAFATEAGLRRWLDERGIALTEPLTPAGTWSFQHLSGSYRTEMHLDEQEIAAFHALVPIVETRTLSNGEYTLARITLDADGARTVHTLNPNVHSRPVYEYFESRNMMDGGAP